MIDSTEQNDDGPYRSPKKIAEAMGHTLDVHLTSYARFQTKEMVEDFDRETVKVN